MSYSHRFQTVTSAALFFAASILGLYSAFVIAYWGDSTPLPTATAPKLVIRGPYRLVRNPMALAGILQGLAVGWWFGSWSVIGYACLGVLTWHFIVRPQEEADLRIRFGRAYESYQKTVGLWIPRRKIASVGFESVVR